MARETAFNVMLHDLFVVYQIYLLDVIKIK